MKYEEAIEKLETISKELENGNVPIEEVAAKLKAARHLVKFCREQLVQVDEQLEKD